METVALKEGKTIVVGKFDKHFSNDEYEVHFNTETGMEVVKGHDGTDPFKTELPLLADVGIMGSCPNSCDFCYQGPVAEPHMSLDNFKTIIDQIKHHTNQVALGGRGDPNLHPRFGEIIEYARSNGVVPNYTTSGIHMTDTQIEISKMCGAVAVSDYLSDFTYSAISRLMDAGIKTNIHMIFSRYTFDSAMKIVCGFNPWKTSQNIQAKSQVDMDRLNAVIFLLFKPQGTGRDKRDMIPHQWQIQSFARKVFEPECKFKIGMDSCLINHVLKYAEPTEIQKMALDTCESSRMSVYISPSMQMIPCSFADHPEWGVKINGEHTIDYIWNRSMKFKQFRSRLKKNPSCCPVGL